MRKVTLNMKEFEKYQVIKELVDHNGNKNRASLRLGISKRQLNRLILVYKTKGKVGFVHGNKNRQPANSLPQELVKRIIDIYVQDYQGFNFKHFTEKLNECEGIDVSYATVYRLLTSQSIFPPREHRTTKKKRAKALIRANKPNISDKDLEVAVKHEVMLEDAHPRKPRAKYFGEEIQMDGSIHRWFGDTKTTLHLAIDNATGMVVGAYFAKQETLDGYYHVYKQILMNYGIPAKFLTDNRTVFNYETSKTKQEHRDVLTQFGYACKTLGTQIETSSVSQKKGQIERANGTFQDRLVSELRKRKISSITEANEYLLDTFLPDFNKRFALDHTKFKSVMESSPEESVIDRTLAICAPRIFDNGSAVSYGNKLYQAYDENSKLIAFKPRTKCLVIIGFDKKMYVTVDDKVYLLMELTKNKSVSEEFDTQAKQQPKKSRKIYIPPMSHPWKRNSFLAQQQRAHYAHQYTG